MKIALLHLAPRAADVTHNRRLVETAVSAAATLGADWIITPEFCISGFTFHEQIGTDWILPQPDPWMREFCRLVARQRVTVFLSHPERDADTGRLHNSVFVIGPDGVIRGTHRKINTLPVGSESWSSPGERATAIPVEPAGSVGVLVCADAYSPWIADSLKAQGATLLVSPAAWAPGLHGPSGEWEQRTLDTGLSLLVCNRTGPDATVDFSQAESVIVREGGKRLSLRAERSAIFTVEWDLAAQDLATTAHRITYL
ncbi:MAG TPA: carbon-nitrogen hydrolase family protein [Candidatus Bathyarchaeia archaeon]|nr:carbon-nitrogen hydrolase family protein [Candidatus Bathyarchaeia archaeon]